MDRAAALKNASAYAAEVCKVLSPCTIIMYGSYANGTQDPESDSDIAVVFNGCFYRNGNVYYGGITHIIVVY